MATTSDYRLYALDELAKDGYPPIWHEVKHEVRADAGHRCVRCLHPYRNGEHGNGEWSPCDERCTHDGPVRCNREIREAHWRILTVHHLDGVKANLRWWNLAALCQRCHLYIQGRVVLERPFILEHSDWFKPYAAGFYAWKYLGQEIDREEAIERQRELLAFEDLGTARLATWT